MKNPFVQFFAQRILPRPAFYQWLQSTGANHSSAILDVGAGSGHLLYCLAQEGFRNLLGVDPYNDSDIDLQASHGFRVLRADLSGIDQSFDIVIMSHVLEHMPLQRCELTKACEKLNPTGSLIVRIPLCDSLAYERYGTNWVQLDAPRHFYLHTRKSFSILAEQCGLAIQETINDSTGFQFWASELYQRDVPLRDSSTGKEPDVRKFFTQAQLDSFDIAANDMNASQRGDQATFILRKQS